MRSARIRSGRRVPLSWKSDPPDSVVRALLLKTRSSRKGLKSPYRESCRMPSSSDVHAPGFSQKHAFADAAATVSKSTGALHVRSLLSRRYSPPRRGSVLPASSFLPERATRR